MASPSELPELEAISKYMSKLNNNDEESTILRAELPPFPYRPLQAGQIRLLQVLLATDDVIFCNMKQVSIGDPHVLFALSYVWGNAKPDYMIIVDREIMGISRHLSDAIRAYYSYSKREGFGPVEIWIDAICINQDDLEEKSIQVPLIGDVYRKATMVLIWFGKLQGHDLTSSRIFEWLVLFRMLNESENHTMEDRLTKMARVAQLERLLALVGVEGPSLIALVEMLETAIGVEDTVEAQQGLQALRDSELGRSLWPADTDLWYALLTFLQHAWFYRIWTIQEVRLAKVALLLQEDTCTFYHFIFEYRRRLFRESYVGPLYSYNIHERVRLTPRLHVSLDLHQSAHFASGREPTTMHPLFNLLIGIRMLGAKDPRDYIYGILGMLDDSITSQITIDYSESTSSETIFTQAIIAACRLEGGESFWSQLMEVYANISRELPSLPSWVPDFSGRQIRPTEQCGPGLSDRVRYKYAHLAHVVFPEGLSVASVRGMCIDRVEYTAATLRAVDVDDETSADKTIYDILQLPKIADMGEDIFCTLFGSEQHHWFCEMDSVFPPRAESAVSGNKTALPAWIAHELLANDLATVAEIYHDLRDFVEFLHTYAIRTFAGALTHPATYIDEISLRRLVPGMMRVPRRTSKRRFFRTTSGRFGFASRQLTSGDNICMIPGDCYWLHVLSGDKDRYVTALAHVEGYMGDSLIDAFPLDGHGWEIFHLR